MMAHKSRPSFATCTTVPHNSTRRGRRTLALMAGTVLAAGISSGALAQAQYNPYGNPLATGPVPFTAVQGGAVAQPYGAQPYGQAYGQPFGGGGQIVSGGGSIVYDRGALGGGGYQAPFYAGVAGQQPGIMAQPGAQYGSPMTGPVPYSSLTQQQAPAVSATGAYGEVGGLLVPGPQAPRSQLYIQPGVAAPGYAQAQVGVASGMLPPAPPATATAAVPSAPTSTPQIATATPALPPAQPTISPTPPVSASSDGPARVPVIVEDASPPPVPPSPPTAADVAAPPAPPQIASVLDDDPAEDTPSPAADIVPPPPPPSSQQSETVAVATPPTPPAPPQPATPTSDAPAQTPSERSDTQPEPVVVPEPPTAVASTDLPDVTPSPTPTGPSPTPSSLTDGSVALSLSFAAGASDLPAGSASELSAIAQQMNADDSLRLTIRAYAEGTAEEASQARRLSLSRALAVRSYLIEQGIRGPRMDVRALGHRIDPPRDRVDLVLVAQ